MNTKIFCAAAAQKQRQNNVEAVGDPVLVSAAHGLNGDYPVADESKPDLPKAAVELAPTATATPLGHAESGFAPHLRSM